MGVTQILLLDVFFASYQYMFFFLLPYSNRILRANMCIISGLLIVAHPPNISDWVIWLRDSPGLGFRGLGVEGLGFRGPTQFEADILFAWGALEHYRVYVGLL